MHAMHRHDKSMPDDDSPRRHSLDAAVPITYDRNQKHSRVKAVPNQKGSEMTASVATAIALLTVRETAAVLRKSEAQLRWMIHTNTAPKSALIGGRRMFRQSDVEDYINKAFEEVA